MAIYHPPPPRLRDHHGTGSGKTVKGRGSENCKETVFCTRHGGSMNSQWWRQHTKYLSELKADKIPSEEVGPMSHL